MNELISIGTAVEFDSEHGPQTGKVTNFLPCLSNGRRHATIEIDHHLDGIVFNMPVDELVPCLTSKGATANATVIELRDKSTVFNEEQT